VSGAAVASAAAMGSTLGPRMKREGYQAPVSAAVNAASAPAGMMIPPSNTLIVYSLVSSTSVATLFVAGYGPGLVWVLACLVVVAIISRTRPGMRARGERVPLGLAVITLLKAVPAILMIVIVIGGLLAGFFTATESAVIAVGYSFVLGLVYRQLTLKNLPTVIAGAGLAALRRDDPAVDLLGSAAPGGLEDRGPAADDGDPADRGSLHGPPPGDPHLHADLPADRDGAGGGPDPLRPDDHLQPLA